MRAHGAYKTSKLECSVFSYLLFLLLLPMLPMLPLLHHNCSATENQCTRQTDDEEHQKPSSSTSTKTKYSISMAKRLDGEWNDMMEPTQRRNTSFRKSGESTTVSVRFFVLFLSFHFFLFVFHSASQSFVFVGRSLDHFVLLRFFFAVGAAAAPSAGNKGTIRTPTEVPHNGKIALNCISFKRTNINWQRRAN